MESLLWNFSVAQGDMTECQADTGAPDMANLGCQLDYIRNELKASCWALILFEAGRSTLNPEDADLLVAAQSKGHGKGNLLWPARPRSHCQVHLSHFRSQH